ncbi:MAG: GrpB family protein [Candidatus Hydrogenedentes bacterium]|nr:GrpB family protein [Candidatus Hydrogenedentota bacterium]
MTVTLVQPYDPAWPSHFQQIVVFLKPGMGEVRHSFEHVGSTAIPGMTAKPIIDINIVITPGTFPEVKGRLEVLGYIHQGDLGIPKREAFDLVDVEAIVRLPKHYLYVCDDDSYELRNQLAFRDFLRQHREWREKLSRLKRELCVKHKNDRQAYIDGKSDMVREITKLAMEDNRPLARPGVGTVNAIEIPGIYNGE